MVSDGQTRAQHPAMMASFLRSIHDAPLAKNVKNRRPANTSSSSKDASRTSCMRTLSARARK